MPAEELGERRGGDRRRAHAGHLIRSDGHADARAANEHAEICIARRNRLGNLNGIVRVIDGIARFGAEIRNITGQLGCHEVRERALLIEAAVVGCNRYAHCCSFRNGYMRDFAPATTLLHSYIRSVATCARPATAITTSRSLRAPAATRVPNQHLLLGLKKNRRNRLHVTCGFLAAQAPSAQLLTKKALIRNLKVLRPFPSIGTTYK